MRTAAQLMIARRYLDRGFLDTAMQIMLRDPGLPEPCDWMRLIEKLMARQRIADVVSVCEVAGIPIPREQLLAEGDANLRRRNLNGAKMYYELGEADTARWARLVDVLTATPGGARLAITIAERHLAAEAPEIVAEPRRASAAS